METSLVIWEPQELFRETLPLQAGGSVGVLESRWHLVMSVTPQPKADWLGRAEAEFKFLHHQRSVQNINRSVALLGIDLLCENFSLIAETFWEKSLWAEEGKTFSWFNFFLNDFCCVVWKILNMYTCWEELRHAEKDGESCALDKNDSHFCCLCHRK